MLPKTKEIEINYIPGPVSTQFHQDTHSRVKLLIGPFGTGKTTSAIWDIIDFQAERVLPTNGVKRSRFAIVRNTYPELRDTTIKTVLDWFPPLYFGKYNQSRSIYIVKIEDKEIEIIFKALDSPQDVRDLLSLELTGAHVDEAREIHQDVIKGLLGRIGRYPSMKDHNGQSPFVTPPQVVLTTNYPSIEHYLYKDFVGEPIEGYAIYKQTQQENKHNLRPNYYEDLEKDYQNRVDLLRTLVRGEWGITVRGREVYPEFIRDTHVSDKPIKPLSGLKYIRGWDNSGLWPACVITQISPIGQWLILKEFCGEDIGVVEFTESVQLWCVDNLGGEAKYQDIGDPAGNIRGPNKLSPKDYMLELGIYVEDGIQTFKARRESVAGRLTKMVGGQPGILIDPSCTRLIDGFEGGYAYPEIGNTGLFKKDPEKNQYSHPHDALQYPATRLFPMRWSDDNERERRQRYTDSGRKVKRTWMNR